MTAIGAFLKITIVGTLNSQVFNNVQWYQTDGAAFLTADAAAVGEAFWNNVKTRYRAIMPNDGAVILQSVKVQQDTDTGVAGEFAIPTGESLGTRDVSGLGGTMPQFNAGGIRLTVATRTTRPGQKRVCGLREGDQDSGVLAAGYVTLLNSVADIWATSLTLGAPVLLGVLHPKIVRLDGVDGIVGRNQDVTGHVTNPNVTSQVSRKIGRGV